LNVVALDKTICDAGNVNRQPLSAELMTVWVCPLISTMSASVAIT